jgi:phosphatidylserine decarboxylase
MSVGIETDSSVWTGASARVGSTKRILVRQIAGLIARRIVTYSKVGERVRQGDRLGIIRFGSRVDVFLPPNSTVRVKVGDQTTAGVTVLAELPR